MYDHNALDATFAWLDGESLLRAGAACRRWRERATRRDAWHGRVTEVGWTRGMRPHDAYLCSLNVQARWRRRHIAATTLLQGRGAMLCADGDWLAFRQLGREVRPSGQFEPWSHTVRIYDAAAARTVGTLTVPAVAMALSRDAGRCATVDAAEGPAGRAACTVWAPPSAAAAAGTYGNAWRAACTVPVDWDALDVNSGRLRWWSGPVLAVCALTRGHGNVRVRAEWFDLGAGEARSVVHREYGGDGRDGWEDGLVQRDDAGAFVLYGDSFYALDPRPSSADQTPLMTLPPVAGGMDRRRLSYVSGDGRRIVTYAHDRDRTRVELWDVRAGRSGVLPAVAAAAASDTHWLYAMCATARGTVLGWAHRRCASHAKVLCDECHNAMEEWDPARGTVDEVMAVRGPESHQMRCVWTDERRAVLQCFDGEGLHLLDADARPSSDQSA